RRHTRFSRDWSSDVCSSDLGDIDTEIRGALAVYRDGELRLGQVVREAGLLEARVLLHFGDDLHRRVRQRLVVVTGQGELQAAAGAPYAEAVRLEREGADAGHVLDQRGNLIEDFLLRALTLCPWRKAHDHEAGILRPPRAGDREGAR